MEEEEEEEEEEKEEEEEEEERKTLCVVRHVNTQRWMVGCYNSL